MLRMTCGSMLEEILADAVAFLYLRRAVIVATVSNADAASDHKARAAKMVRVRIMSFRSATEGARGTGGPPHM